MPPIRFACQSLLSIAPEAIAAQILDLAQWTSFQGYGPIPGIRSATFALRTEGVVGTQISVVNRDGSAHIEEITEWEPNSRLALRMHSFTPPVSLLATHFIETWTFAPEPRTNSGASASLGAREATRTLATRSFELHPRSIFARPILWLISFFLKAAIQKHTQKIASAEGI